LTYTTTTVCPGSRTRTRRRWPTRKSTSASTRVSFKKKRRKEDAGKYTDPTVPDLLDILRHVIGLDYPDEPDYAYIKVGRGREEEGL